MLPRRIGERMRTIEAERITFRSEGVDLVGDLRLAVAGERRPAVALTGPFTGVKEQVVGSYAELLTVCGITTLAFDHRGFGESGGRRQHEDSQGKLADLRAAVSVLAGRAGVDPARIGLVGVCLGGGYAIRAAAADPASRQWLLSLAATTAPSRWSRRWASAPTGRQLAMPWSALTSTCPP